METDLRARPDRHAQSPRVLARARLPAPLPTFSCDGEESSGDGMGGSVSAVSCHKRMCALPPSVASNLAAGTPQVSSTWWH